MNIWIAVIMSTVIGFAVAFLPGFAVIPFLHKLKFGQTILDIGPSWHKKKQGTPTMGGILIFSGFVFSLTVVLATDYLVNKENMIFTENIFIHDVFYVKVFSGILTAAAFGFIGFIDDYIKVVKKRNLGLTVFQKTLMQLLVIVVYLFTLNKFAGVNYMFVPYMGIWANTAVYWIIGVPAIYCTVNAVNFTDGIDGLCTSVTGVVCVAFAVCAVLRGYTGFSMVCCCLLGALAGFLVWNRNPAKVIMGDVGSLFLGGMVCALAYTIDEPWAILLIGIIYVAEFGSDIIQIYYCRTHNGKRLFKMAPLHHHYEMSGWSEKRICAVFSFVTVIGSLAAVALNYFGREQ